MIYMLYGNDDGGFFMSQDDDPNEEDEAYQEGFRAGYTKGYAKGVDVVGLVREILNSENTKSLTSGFGDLLKGWPSKSLEIAKRNVWLNIWRLVQEFSILIIVLVAVILLAAWGKLESSTLGTLMGAIIGYSLGKMKRDNSKS